MTAPTSITTAISSGCRARPPTPSAWPGPGRPAPPGSTGRGRTWTHQPGTPRSAARRLASPRPQAPALLPSSTSGCRARPRRARGGSVLRPRAHQRRQGVGDRAVGRLSKTVFEPRIGAIMNTQQMPQRFLPFMGVLLLAACTAPDGGRPAVSVSVVPTTASLLTSGSQDFTATVTNDPTNRGVAWSITGCSGDASVCGSLSNMTSTRATYTAPTTAPPALGVTATAVKDNSKSFTATVAITAIAPAGQIAFTSQRDGYEEIYVTNADGSGVTRLTNNPARDVAPAWSPDGSKILFETNRDGNWEVYVMNADGSGPLNL